MLLSNIPNNYAQEESLFQRNDAMMIMRGNLPSGTQSSTQDPAECSDESREASWDFFPSYL